MGAISNYDIESIKKNYNLDYFLETGTNEGKSITYCVKYNFIKYLSVELIKEQYDKSCNNLNLLNNVRLYLGDTLSQLPKMLATIPKDKNILFWLDAHLPSFYSSEYDLSNLDLEFPLEKELEIIKRNRDTKNDYFLIDDLRIYEDGNYQAGNAPKNHRHPNINDINFIIKMFAETHIIEKDFKAEGSIILIPKNK